VEALVAAAPETPVLVLSGRTDDELAVEAIRAGAQDFLLKRRTDGVAIVRAVRFAVERNRIVTELAHRALHDPLTGLPNRTLFLDRLQQALSRLARTETALAVVFLDLDGFKELNDTRGHAAGDERLVQVAVRLSALLRAGDTAARIGGDEFVVLCEDIAGPDEASGIAGRLLAELPVPASMGVAVTHNGGVSPQTLVAEADAAMYRAKLGGGASIALAGRPR
jgi:diguanylate cyclase (GGDEF)-like protein